MNTMSPRLLLIEDDVVSCAFLREALSGLPAQVDAVASIGEARAQADSHGYALWLIDANLPDGDGCSALAALREAHPDTPALAITAQAQRDDFDRLCAAGFLEVLQKPITVAALQASVRRVLMPDATMTPAWHVGEKRPIWNEALALAAVGGRRESLLALRGLFLDELPKQRDAVLAACAARDSQAARAALHKLKAGCSFVGAVRLLQAVDQLSVAPLDAGNLELWKFAVADQLATAALTPDDVV